jgi:hypothetical protein
LTALVVAIVAGLYALARGHFRPAELAVGTATLVALVAVGAGFAVPLGALNLQIPVLAALIAAGVLASGRPDARPGMARWVACLVLALPVLALLVPMTQLVWTAMSFTLAPALGGLVALTLLLLLPTLEWLGEPNRFWAPLAALVVAGLFVGVGIAGAAPSAERPAPSTLIFAQDHTTLEAQWLTSDGPGRDWAGDQVGAFDEEGPVEAFGLGGSFLVRPAQRISAPAPLLALDGDTGAAAGAGRRLGGALTLPLGAELVRLRLPDDGGARFVAVGGTEISEGTTRLDHWGRPAGDTLTFVVALDPGASLPEIDAVEHHLRPAELLGADPFVRPDHLVPDPRRSSDRALFRSLLGPTVESLMAPGDSVSETVRTDSLPPPPVPDSGGVRLVPDTVADTLGTPGGTGRKPIS